MSPEIDEQYSFLDEKNEVKKEYNVIESQKKGDVVETKIVPEKDDADVRRISSVVRDRSVFHRADRYIVQNKTKIPFSRTERLLDKYFEKEEPKTTITTRYKGLKPEWKLAQPPVPLEEELPEGWAEQPEIDFEKPQS